MILCLSFGAPVHPLEGPDVVGVGWVQWGPLWHLWCPQRRCARGRRIQKHPRKGQGGHQQAGSAHPLTATGRKIAQGCGPGEETEMPGKLPAATGHSEERDYAAWSRRPVMPASEEAEAGGSEVQAQPGELSKSPPHSMKIKKAGAGLSNGLVSTPSTGASQRCFLEEAPGDHSPRHRPGGTKFL